MSHAPSRCARAGFGTVLSVGSFVALNAAILALAPEGAAYVFGGDAQSWYEPALALLRHGAYVELDAPDTPHTYRPPLYPLFLAAVMAIAGEGNFAAIAVAQLAVLLATAAAGRELARRCGLGAAGANAAMLLIAFNPNALGAAHLIQSETLSALAVTVFALAATGYAQSATARRAALAGLALGLCVLVRPQLQLLVVLAPPLLLVLAWSAGARPRSWAQACRPLWLLVAAGIVLAPWLVHMERAGEGLRPGALALQAAYLRDQAAFALRYEVQGLTLEQAQARVNERLAQAVAAATPPDAALAPRAQARIRIDEAERILMERRVPALALALVQSWAQMFGAPGVVNLLSLLGLEARGAALAFARGEHETYLDAAVAAMRAAGPAALALWSAALAFTIVVRLAAVAGAIALVARREWTAVLLAGTIVGYLALVHLFGGQARYRVPVDPLLLVMTAAGWEAARARFARARPRS